MSETLLPLINQAALPLLLVVIALSAWLKRTRVALLGVLLACASALLWSTQASLLLLPPIVGPFALLLLALWPDGKVFSANSALYVLALGLLAGLVLALPEPKALALLAMMSRPVGLGLGIGSVVGLSAAILALLRWVISARVGLAALAIVAALATFGFTRFAGEPLSLAFMTLSAVFLLVHLASQAYRMSYLDALTELNGRRALTEELGLLGRNYVIAMVDIDHFKSINDRHGHDVGDQALKALAKRLRGVKGARAFRFGGEEFCLTFAGSPLDLVVERLNQLRVRIEADVLTPKPKAAQKRAPSPIKLTVSIGVAPSKSGLSAQEVLKEADQALYRAKQAGRNRVTAAR